MGGIGTKLSTLYRNACLGIYDIIILVETWLTKDHSIDESDIPDFDIYRTDRNILTSNKLKGGGVLIAVRKGFKSKQIQHSEQSVEHNFVSLTFGNVKYIAGAVYIPPNSPQEIYENHCSEVSAIMTSNPNHCLLLFGDYNLPDAVWVNECNGVGVVCPNSSPANIVCNTYSFLNCCQMLHIPNNRGVFLDLLFSNVNDLTVSTAVDLLLGCNNHHIAYSCAVPVRFELDYCKVDQWYYDFRNADYICLNNFLASCDWETILDKNDINLAVGQLYDILYEGISLYVPVKKFKLCNFPVWFSNHLKSLIVKKKIAHKCYKQSNLPEDYQCFSYLRDECKQLEQQCYQNYIVKRESDLFLNPRDFWKHVRNRKPSAGYPNSMHFNDVVSESISDSVNLFADYFSTVYTSDHYAKPDYYASLPQAVDASNIFLNISDVFDQIMTLKPKTSYGPDGVPTLLLRECVCTLAKPLYVLFSLSLKTGIFPDYWKHSFITPIFKSGDRHDVTNYRAICIQSAIPKLFDLLVTLQLSEKCKRFIVEEQYGFMSARSTTSNLLTYQDHLLGAFERRHQVDSIYTDFSKAFDRVNHNLLLEKLEAYGIGHHIVTWLRSFLDDRKQYVRVNNYISNHINTTSGVPQGSHCGPLLFILFVNDIKLFLNDSCNFLMYADDMKIFKEICDPSDCIILQNYVDRFFQWSKLNGLDLNVNKCTCISFFRINNPVHFVYCINGNVLKRVVEMKDLGIVFDNKLTFTGHINNLIQRAYGSLGYVCRYGCDFSPMMLKVLYCCFVRPILEYCCSVWSPFYRVHINDLERVQNKFLRLCSFKLNIPLVDGHVNYNSVLNRLNLCTLEDRRLHADLCFMFRLINGTVGSEYLLHKISFNIVHRTRFSNLFYPSNSTTNYSIHNPLVRMQRRYNEFDLPIHGSIISFKNLIKKKHWLKHTVSSLVSPSCTYCISLSLVLR